MDSSTTKKLSNSDEQPGTELSNLRKTDSGDIERQISPYAQKLNAYTWFCSTFVVVRSFIFLDRGGRWTVLKFASGWIFALWYRLWYRVYHHFARCIQILFCPFHLYVFWFFFYCFGVSLLVVLVSSKAN